MIDVHLIGYTADLQHLVLDLDGDAGGRYRLVIDPDLLATLDEIRVSRPDLAGAPAPAAVDDDEVAADPDDDGDLDDIDDLETDDALVPDEDEDEFDHGEAWDDPEPPAPPPATPRPGTEVVLDDDPDDLEGLVLDADADLDFIDDHLGATDEPFEDRVDDRSPFAPPRHEVAEQVRVIEAPEPLPESVPEPVAAPPEVDDAPPEPDVAVTPEPEPAPPAPRPAAASPPPRPAPPPSKLTPAEIQAHLRAGRSPKSVAELAGTDVAWIERWLAPIIEERARILREAHSLKLERPRLGRSRDALGEAVRKGLKQRSVDPGEAAWETNRRADGRWKVSVKFRHRGRSRTASWLFDPREGEIDAASDLARELGFTRRRNGTAGAAKKSSASARKRR